MNIASEYEKLFSLLEMALRSKGERKPVYHDTVPVDVGKCYSSASSTTVTANRIDKFLWVSCKEAERVQKIESEKGSRNTDDGMCLPFGFTFIALCEREQDKLHTVSHHLATLQVAYSFRLQPPRGGYAHFALSGY